MHRFYVDNKIYISYNYGQTWQPSNSISSSWFGVAVSDNGGTIFGAAYSTSPGIYKSSQLQDALTSNTWAGPQSGTSGKAWESIASDSIGMNLVAGTCVEGKCLHPTDVQHDVCGIIST